MQILLINPPQDTRYPQPPIGLAGMASVLEGNGYSVEILDAPALGLTERQTVEEIKRKGADVVGVTAVTPTIGSALGVARGAREVGGGSLVVLGGPHVTVLSEETLRMVPEVDVVVRGEGERTMLELVRTWEEDEAKKGRVLGVTYREDGVVRSNPPRPYISDLDSLPFPAYHLLPVERYRPHPPHGRRLPFMAMVTSRGCPYRCIYCAKACFGRRYRANSPSYVVDEVRYLVEEFNVREITFYDDVFTLDRKRAYAICEELMSGRVDVPWTCETRVNLVDREVLECMRRAGCYMIAYGVESGNQRILNNLRKDITLDQAIRAFELTHEVGIQTVAYFMIGSPGDTPETIRETIEFAKRLDPDFAQFSITTPYPGTELFDLASEEGVMPEEWGRYIYADLRSIDLPVFETETLTRENLKEWTAKAYKEFYLRLRYLWKRVKKTRSLDELRTNLRGFRVLFDMIR